jgi:Fe-S-cluster containining protein
MLSAIIANYRQLLHRVDAWFDHCLAAAGAHIACSQGCSGCCRGLFDITILDAYLLQQGFATLTPAQRRQVMPKVADRCQQLQQLWPEFRAPYVLNRLPHLDWQQMPEDDLTPCPLLGADDRCLVYAYRPLTCRLHGISHVDFSGEIFSENYCTLNFVATDPLEMAELRGDFRQIFQREVELLSAFTHQLTGRSQTELDTFIPTALLMDFSHESLGGNSSMRGEG